MPSPTRLVVSDVAVADLGMEALRDVADRNRLEATDARLERVNAGVAGLEDDLMFVPPEETPSTPFVSPQSALHSDSDVLKYENPPGEKQEVCLTHQPQCDAALPFLSHSLAQIPAQIISSSDDDQYVGPSGGHEIQWTYNLHSIQGEILWTNTCETLISDAMEIGNDSLPSGSV
jgi:hypothetical protein